MARVWSWIWRSTASAILLGPAACGSDAATNAGSESEGIGPPTEIGEPCEAQTGCGVGLFCSDGACASCGTGEAAPGKLCFSGPVLITERFGRLKLIRLRGGPAVLADNAEVHFRLLLPDDAGSLDEQWLPGLDRRIESTVVDVTGDGIDELIYCSWYSGSHCRVSEVGEEAIELLANFTATGARFVAGVPPHQNLPGRVFGAYDPAQWRSWLLYPTGNTRGAPLPIVPTNQPLSGDFDGDGIPDLAAPVDATLVLLSLNDSGIAYEAITSTPIPPDSELLTAADVGGDGRPDVLLTTPSGELLVATFSEAAEVTLSEPIALGRQLRSIALGDLDRDGRLDLAVGDASQEPALGEQPELDRILVLAQTEPGAFERLYLRFPGSVGSIAMIDINSDLHLDLLVSNPEGIYLMTNDP